MQLCYFASPGGHPPRPPSRAWDTTQHRRTATALQAAHTLFSVRPQQTTYNPDDPQTAPVYGVDLLYAASYTGSVAPYSGAFVSSSNPHIPPAAGQCAVTATAVVRCNGYQTAPGYYCASSTAVAVSNVTKCSAGSISPAAGASNCTACDTGLVSSASAKACITPLAAPATLPSSCAGMTHQWSGKRSVYSAGSGTTGVFSDLGPAWDGRWCWCLGPFTMRLRTHS